MSKGLSGIEVLSWRKHMNNPYVHDKTQTNASFSIAPSIFFLFVSFNVEYDPEND